MSNLFNKLCISFPRAVVLLHLTWVALNVHELNQYTQTISYYNATERMVHINLVFAFA